MAIANCTNHLYRLLHTLPMLGTSYAGLLIKVNAPTSSYISYYLNFKSVVPMTFKNNLLQLRCRRLKKCSHVLRAPEDSPSCPLKYMPSVPQLGYRIFRHYFETIIVCLLCFMGFNVPMQLKL